MTKYFKRTEQCSFHESIGCGMIFLLKYYSAFIILSFIYKIIFLALNHGDDSCTFGNYADVLLHGVRHDLAIAGYFTAIPLLLTMAKLFIRPPLRIFYKTYNGIIAFAISLAFVADITLYPYWEQKLDASSILVYIDSPANAIASITTIHIIVLAIVLTALTFATYKKLSYICKDESRNDKDTESKTIHKVTKGIIYILAVGFMFLGIRGGTTESTNNIGTVYYSDSPTLNDAA
ncbi:MAG: hypothetical protein IIW77_08505, partial [Bacteroidaceae bacterium]|nr:hypothetical protein [Bacteroidaceae bacterium]